VREESHLDEMRAAVRGDRQRAEQRRARDAEPMDEATPEAEPPGIDAPEAEPQPEQAGFLKRLTRRSQST
jgi:hypothetical protein